MSSFIGCKISLISKAGIRYEGVLYTIDPKESTVALSKVKSFGTEDRKVERVIPARDEIYEYIIFRGSDIQDLNVCERNRESTLLLEDSAIVRAETSISSNLPPGVLKTDLHQGDSSSSVWKPGNHRPSVKEKITNNMVKAQPPKDDATSKHSANIQPIGSNRHIHSGNDAKRTATVRRSDNGHSDVPYERGKPKAEKAQNPNEKYGVNYRNYDYDYGYDLGYKGRENTYRNSTMEYSKNRDYNNYGKPASRYHRADYRQDQYYTADSYNLRGFESSEQSRDYSYSQYYDYKPSRQNQDRYTYDNAVNKPKRRSNNSENNKSKEAVFKEDYDFETANAIIAKELANMNVSQDKKDNKDEEDVIKEDGENYEDLEAACYDKNKSFFDKISSEMIDRANGKIVRPMNRKEERKMNVETFGVSDANRNVGRSVGKWSRGARFNSRPGRASGGGGGGGGNYVDAVYRGTCNSDASARKDVSHKALRGYSNGGRRPMAAGGPGRGDIY